MKNLEKLRKISLFPGLEKFFLNIKEFYFTNICIIVIFNQVLNLCVYRIVLLIPAAFEFIVREIPANIYWI